MKKELFDTANNHDNISANLLTNENVSVIHIAGLDILAVDIPRAKRSVRPVHVTRNPFSGNSYIRRHEGDQHLDKNEVQRMIAERNEEGRDAKILIGFDLPDIDSSSLQAYRHVFTTMNPEHPWNSKSDREFLRVLGGWRLDRERKQEGLTLAGLLMFGTLASIQEELPNYMLDYQERPEAKAELRWIDRLTLDGRWSGNLYDFYVKVYQKITADLKIPFALQHGQRLDVTTVHIALREALVNCIVHADYSDRASVLVVKRPDMFGFRNPGLMRIPVESALQGGNSDCRNRSLHKMFRMVGAGEQAGTGVPKIMDGWKSQHWRSPNLHDTSEPFNQTLLELRMIDLFPEGVMIELQKIFGSRFDELNRTEQVALAVAASEGTVTHARLRTLTAEHTFDLTKTLQYLKHEGFLDSSGGGRGAVYHIVGDNIPTPEDVFAPRSPDNTPSPDRDENGCLVSEQLAFPVVDDLGKLSEQFRKQLELLADQPRKKARISRDAMINTILTVCAPHFVTISCLAELVCRKPDTLREQYLARLVRERKLTMAFPTKPTHEKQAYRSSEQHTPGAI